MKEKHKIIIIGLSLALFSFIIRWMVINQTNHPSGWDGYYYVMQIHTFFRDGVMHASDRSLIYPFFIGLSYLCPDYVFTVKLGTSILSMAFTVCCYYVVLNKYNDWRLATVIGILTVFSSMATFFVMQFPKNLMGLCFLVLFIAMMDHKNYKWALLFFICSFFTHRSSAIIAIMFICNIQIGILVRHKMIILMIIIGIITSSIFMKGIIHWSDLMRFKNEFNTIPQIAFYSFYEVWRDNISFVWLSELIIAFIAVIVYMYMSIKHKTNYIWLFVIGILLLPFFKLDASTIGYRFFLIAYMLMMISIFPNLFSLFKDRILMVLGMVLIVGTCFSYQSYTYKHFDLPYDNYMAISPIIKHDKKHDLVIAHKGLKEVLVLKGIEATNWNVSDTIKANRIIHGLTLYELKALTKKEYLGNGYFMTSNADWRKFCNLKHSEEITRKIYSWSNPYQIKPYFLRKGE